MEKKKLTLKSKKTQVEKSQSIPDVPVSDVTIDTLSDRDHVRLRRGMYLPNMNYCAYEIMDNSVDEFMAGVCKNILLQIEPDKTMRIQDDGRGVPLQPSKKDPNKPMVQVALGELKSGGKFNQKKENAVKTGGLHGTGASAVNFTCDEFKAIVTQNGEQYEIAWTKGLLTEPLNHIGSAPEGLEHGTLIELKPDMEIWGESDYDLKAIEKRAEQLTFLNAGLNIILDIDYNNTKIEKEICNPDGLPAYILKLSEKKEAIIDPISISGRFNHPTLGDVDVEIALSYNTGYNEEVYAFTNNIPNPLGGHHLTGFKEGLFKSINNYYIDNTKGKTVDLESSDCREGLIAVISVKLADPVFDGQGKAKLDMPAIRGIVKDSVIEMMDDYLDKNPNQAKLILAKALQAQLTRESVRRARETTRAGKNAFTGKPPKLAGCTSKNPEECELWIVEGDSAAGTAKKARDKKTQAILPIFGKINNPYNITLEECYKSPKLKDAITAFGTDIGENFNIENLNYHKIIIMSDADVDGLHIQTLWMAFMYKFFRPIIEAGHLYLSCPPLFKVTKGKKEKFCYTVEEKDEAIAEFGGGEAQRYKGLGEMNEKELGPSTMNIDTRVLIQVTCEDAESAESILDICMGNDASLRKDLLLSDVDMDLV